MITNDGGSRALATAVALLACIASGATDRFVPLAVFDGKRVLTVSDKVAYLWDAHSGRMLSRFVGHQSGIGAVALSPDRKLVATGGYAGMMPWNPGPKDLSVRLWSARSGSQIAQLKGHTSPVTAAQFSFDGKRLLTADTSGRMIVWAVASRKQLLVLEDKDLHAQVTGASFSPDCREIVAIRASEQAYVWDSVTGKEICHIPRGRYGHDSVVFSPDGKLLLTTCAERIAQLWDANTGKEIRRFVGHRHFVHDACFTPDGKRIVSCSRDRTVKLWDVATGKEIRSLANPGAVDNIVVSSDGRYCLAKWEPRNGVEVPFGSSLWDLETGKEILRMNHQETDGIIGFAPDGKSFFVVGGWWQSSLLRETATGRILTRLEVIGDHDFGGPQSYQPIGRGQVRAGFSGAGSRFSPRSDFDGKRLLTVKEHSADLWDATNGRLVAHFAGHADNIGAVAISGDGKLVATAGGEGIGGGDGPVKDASVRLWDATTGKELARLDGQKLPNASVQFSPDSRKVIAVDIAGSVRVWDTSTKRGRQIARSSDSDAAFSRDCSKVALIIDGSTRVSIRDAGTGREMARLKQADGTGSFESAAFDRDGSQVITASLSGIAQTWDAKSGKELRRFEGHSGYLYDAYFAGRDRVVTAGEDGTVRVWDAASGKETARLGNPGVVLRIIVSPDGNRLLAMWCSERDGGLAPSGSSLWNLETGKEIERSGMWNIAPDGLIGFSADSKAFVTSMWWTEEQLTEVRSADTGEVVRKYNLVR